MPWRFRPNPARKVNALGPLPFVFRFGESFEFIMGSGSVSMLRSVPVQPPSSNQLIFSIHLHVPLSLHAPISSGSVCMLQLAPIQSPCSSSYSALMLRSAPIQPPCSTQILFSPRAPFSSYPVSISRSAQDHPPCSVRLRLICSVPYLTPSSGQLHLSLHDPPSNNSLLSSPWSGAGLHQDSTTIPSRPVLFPASSQSRREIINSWLPITREITFGKYKTCKHSTVRVRRSVLFATIGISACDQSVILTSKQMQLSIL